jgi:hypothetical protein
MANFIGHWEFLIALFGLVLLTSVVHSQLKRNWLTPGTVGLPILGNAKGLMTAFPLSNTFAHSPCIGPLVYLNGGGQHIVVINTPEAAVDLLERKAGLTTRGILTRTFIVSTRNAISSSGQAWQRRDAQVTRTWRRVSLQR